MEISPELIKKETSCVTTNTLIRYAEKEKLNIGDFLKGIPYPYQYLTNTKNWIKHQFTKEMYQRLVEMTGDEWATFKAGAYSFELRTLGIVEIMARLFAGPDIVYKNSEKISWKFNRIYRMIPEEVTKNHAVIKVKYLPDFEPTVLGCRYTQGILAVAPQGWMLPRATIKELQCQADGADSCIYEVGFLEKRGFAKNVWYQTFGRAAIIRKALRELEENYAALEAQRDELLEHKHNLEGLVQERTQELADANAELKEANAELETANKTANEQTELAKQRLEETVRLQERLVALAKQETASNIIGGHRHEIAQAQNSSQVTALVIQNEYIPELNTIFAELIEKLFEYEDKPITEADIEKDFTPLLDRYERVMGSPEIKGTHLFDAISNIVAQNRRIRKILDRYASSMKAKVSRGKEAYSLRQIVDENLSTYKANIASLGITVDFKCEEDYQVVGDREHYQSIFGNLISNAIEAIKNEVIHSDKDDRRIIINVKGERELEDKEYDKHLRILFADTGKGMTDEEKSGLVFQESYTTKVGEEGQELGSGLGMGIIRSHVSLYGGNIRILGSKQHRGTTIELYLPLAK